MISWCLLIPQKRDKEAQVSCRTCSIGTRSSGKKEEVPRESPGYNSTATINGMN